MQLGSVFLKKKITFIEIVKQNYFSNINDFFKVIPEHGAGAGMLRLLHFQTKSLINVTYVFVEQTGCSKISITDIIRPILDP